MLQDGKLDFVTRSAIEKITSVIPQGTKVTLGKWIQTTGKGVEEATELSTKTLF